MRPAGVQRVLVLSLILAVLMWGCATTTTRRVEVSDAAAEIEAEKQRLIALEALIKDKFRLIDAAYPVYRESVPLCEKNVSFDTGILAANTFSIAEEMRKAASLLYGISDQLKIIHVIKGSAAEQSGLRKGDILLRVNDWSVPETEKAGEEFLKEVSQEASKGNISMKVRRDGTEQTHEIVPDKVCDYNIALSSDDRINAYADGKNVIITRGMMRFTENDTELALVISHELAHNAMKHMRARNQNVMLGSVLDIVAAVFGVNTGGTFGSIGAQAYSREFEAEADYVGLYMMALSEMDIEGAPQFWRRMAALHPGNIETNFMATHPATPQRFLALEKTVEEIRQKKARGLPLRPEMKREESDTK